jgi:hypothetical protein
MKLPFVTLAVLVAAAIGVPPGPSPAWGRNVMIAVTDGKEPKVFIVAHSRTSEEDSQWLPNNRDTVTEKERDGGYPEKELAGKDRMPFNVENVPTIRYDCAGLVLRKGGLLVEPYGIAADAVLPMLQEFGRRIKNERALEDDVAVCYDNQGSVSHVAYVIQRPELPFMSIMPTNWDGQNDNAVVLSKDQNERVYVCTVGRLKKIVGENGRKWPRIEFWRVPWRGLKAEIVSGKITITKDPAFTPEPEAGVEVEMKFEYTVPQLPPEPLEVREEVTVLGTKAIKTPAYLTDRKPVLVTEPKLSGKPNWGRGNAGYTHVFKEAGDYTWRIELKAPGYDSVTRDVKCHVKESTKSLLKVTLGAEDGGNRREEQVRDGGAYGTKDPNYGVHGGCADLPGGKSKPSKPLIRGHCGEGPTYFGLRPGQLPPLPKPPPGRHHYLFEVMDAHGRVIESLRFTVADGSTMPPDKTEEIRKAAVQMADPNDFHNQFKTPLEVYDVCRGVVQNRIERREWDAAWMAQQGIEGQFAGLISKEKEMLWPGIQQVRHLLGANRGDFATALAAANELKNYTRLTEDYLRFYHDVAQASVAHCWTFGPGREKEARAHFESEYGWPVGDEPPPPAK